MTAHQSLKQLPLTQLKGVGPALAQKLQQLGLFSLQDLIFHLPLRYEDRTQISSLGSLRVGSTAVVEGEVVASQVQYGRRRSLLVRIRDATGSLSLRFFYFSAALHKQLAAGTQVRCYGEARPGATGLEIYHPELKFLQAHNADLSLEANLTPVYPSTEGLAQNKLRQLVQQALVYLNQHPPADLLPQEHPLSQTFPSLLATLNYLHQPPVDADLELLQQGLHPAQRRLALEELLAQQLAMLQLRQKSLRFAAPSLALPLNMQLEQQFLVSLPFQPTQAQQRVSQEIYADLAQPQPMLRLVQGDVGSGKTLVAALAALRALSCGYQAALMAPTELLAEQHFKVLSDWFTPLGKQVALLTGRIKGKARQQILVQLAAGQIDLLLGTHAIFQDEVKFAQLALVIIDEQHRFGVHQRLALREKGIQGELQPHQLVMTATPIPRTLAMSAYADLDVSVIDELPPGRQAITTLVMPSNRRPELIARVRQACLEGRQAYWVCTLIEESEVLECQAAEVTAQELILALPEIKVGLVHGRLKAEEKAAVMQDFQDGTYQLLVATTVIEVGVDVPNASLMLIDNAERLGLAQLHQLRGRVGRGATASFCVLVYQPPLSEQGRKRLQVMRETTNGFVIAEQDLHIRGPGELLGTKQTGTLNLHLADLVRDQDLLVNLKPLAEHLLRTKPEQVQALLERWQGDNLKFAQA